MAASIIRDKISLSVYNLPEYPTFEDTKNGSSVIPESLKLFLYKLLGPDGKNSAVVTRRCTAIAHFVIATCRPRSFISPLLLAISYEEVQRLENGMISAGEPSYGLECFTQFVFDNADFNVATLTGHNTFHAMGGIACVTPPGKLKNARSNA